VPTSASRTQETGQRAAETQYSTATHLAGALISPVVRGMLPASRHCDQGIFLSLFLCPASSQSNKSTDSTGHCSGHFGLKDIYRINKEQKHKIEAGASTDCWCTLYQSYSHVCLTSDAGGQHVQAAVLRIPKSVWSRTLLFVMFATPQAIVTARTTMRRGDPV
jgi:hypothetical protein